MDRRKLMTAACLALVPRLGNAQGPARDAELIRAAEAGDAPAVKRLLGQGASVRARAWASATCRRGEACSPA